MSITTKVYNFPTFKIEKQLFYVPGAASDAGLTSGGARIMSPEPGGFSALRITPALQTDEWNYPLSSWLMSKTNGQVLRVRLAITPQVAGGLSGGPPFIAETIYPESPWDNAQNFAGEAIASYYSNVLEGTNVVQIDMIALGRILQPGHVIGHYDTTYMIDEITYNAAHFATITITPPLRRNMTAGDAVFFRPWFTGTISNPSQFLQPYDAGQAGNIQIGEIILTESIIP